jgi:hypothetical protein
VARDRDLQLDHSSYDTGTLFPIDVTHGFPTYEPVKLNYTNDY